MATAWTERSERGSLSLLRFMVWLARRLGRTALQPLLVLIAGYFFLTSPEARRASHDFLSRAMPRRPSFLDVFRHIHCFATTILDRVLLFSKDGWEFAIDVSDPDDLLERMQRGQGCLLIGSHLGSFDMLRAFTVQRTELKLKILMHADHSRKLTDMLTALSPEIAETLQPMRGPGDLLRLREWIEEGYIVALLGDRAMPGEEEMTVDFLGAPALFPISAIQLGAVLKAPVFTFFGLYLGGRRYSAHFDLLAERIELPRTERVDATRRWLQAYADRLGHYARLAPFNWFNFFPFWRA
jgi:predicted LPLAT superfamily acyltransferase